jgi:hypothetical protein
LLSDSEGRVELDPVEMDSVEMGDEVWMAFNVPFEVRPTHFFNHRRLDLTMVDFASAGNRWSEENLFRTWLPQPLYLGAAYPKGTWKLIYPDGPERPVRPVRSL